MTWMLSLNAIFTAERAEGAKNKHHFTMLAGLFLYMLCDRKHSPAGRDASSGGEIVSKQFGSASILNQNPFF